jgi:predicted transcriptional regulator
MVNYEILLKIIRSSKVKIKILKMLKQEPHYVREISRKLNIFPSATLKHIKFLGENNLITFEKIGKTKYYRLTETGKKLLNSP